MKDLEIIKTWFCEFFFAAVLIVVISSSVLASDHSLSIEGSKILLSGEIDEKLSAEFSKSLSDSINEVVITSAGGELEPAISIGSEIKKRNLSVLVKGYCFSACAQYIFLAANLRKVDELSLVGFHNTATSISSFTFQTDDRHVYEYYLDKANEEEKFFQDIQVSNVFLYLPQQKIQTVCYTYEDISNMSPQNIVYAATFDVWIPTRYFLEQAGIKMMGFWPTNLEDVIASMKHSLPSRIKPRILLDGAEFPMDISRLKTSLSAVHRCPESEINRNSLPRRVL